MINLGDFCKGRYAPCLRCTSDDLIGNVTLGECHETTAAQTKRHACSDDGFNQFCANRNTRTGKITDIEGLKYQDCKDKNSRKRGRRGRRKQRRIFSDKNRKECCSKRLERNDKVHCVNKYSESRQIHVVGEISKCRTRECLKKHKSDTRTKMEFKMDFLSFSGCCATIIPST